MLRRQALLHERALERRTGHKPWAAHLDQDLLLGEAKVEEEGRLRQRKQMDMAHIHAIKNDLQLGFAEADHASTATRRDVLGHGDTASMAFSGCEPLELCLPRRNELARDLVCPQRDRSRITPTVLVLLKQRESDLFSCFGTMKDAPVVTARPARTPRARFVTIVANEEAV